MADERSVALLLRVYGLWDNKRSVRYALICGFTICFSISVAFAIALLIAAFGASLVINVLSLTYEIDVLNIGMTNYEQIAHSCMIMLKDNQTYLLAGGWAGMVRVGKACMRYTI